MFYWSRKGVHGNSQLMQNSPMTIENRMLVLGWALTAGVRSQTRSTLLSRLINSSMKACRLPLTIGVEHTSFFIKSSKNASCPFHCWGCSCCIFGIVPSLSTTCCTFRSFLRHLFFLPREHSGSAKI